MDRAKWPALSAFLLGTVVLTCAIPKSFAFDRPVHSSVAVLAGSGATIIALSRWLPKEASRSSLYKSVRRDTLPLIALGLPHPSREPSPAPTAGQDAPQRNSLRKLKICFLLLISLLCLRVEVVRQIVENVQCAGRSWTAFLPLGFALLDAWAQETPKRTAYSGDSSVFHRMLHSPHVYLVSTALMSFGATLAVSSLAGPKSTYICAAGLRYRRTVPGLQFLGAVLDFVSGYCIVQLMSAQDPRGSRTVATQFLSVGWALLASATFWLVVGIMYWVVQETGRRWLLTIPASYLWAVTKLTVYMSFTLVSALLTIVHFGILTTVILGLIATSMTVTMAASWSALYPFPHQSVSVAHFGITLLLAGVALYIRARTQSADDTLSQTVSYRRHAWLQAVLLLLFAFWSAVWLLSEGSLTTHPIDLLIEQAQSQHSLLRQQMSSSRTLANAVREYNIRYGHSPPPNFDKWYRYATDRESRVIDAYDRIHRDLLPFHALKPEEIRARTWAVISNPWNDAAGISIRNGSVTIAPNVVPTHKWMLEGIVEMISKFAIDLPDMDLAFNLNDECRVSVPYEMAEQMRRIGNKTRYIIKPQQSFSKDTAKKWRPVPEEPNPWTPFAEFSWQQTFHRVGNKGCPPTSQARQDRPWDTGTFCVSCARPHSLGPFLANWTLAGDVCHQPDLANLHGLYLSPAAFKSTNELYPIFSQSKAHGFNDILYPSAWNYIEKAKYSPNDEHPDKLFAEKDDALFWRGATSEGFSHGNQVGQWKGMSRQRHVHILNNISGNPAMPLLLPSRDDGSKLAYKQVPVTKLVEFLPTDAHFVDSILRCGAPDCDQQATEFGLLASPTNFQDHWKYKYLLDLDGAGFSGRFLPFLRSRSLPFKAALFREWWDDRVTPWKHFVPLDIRGQGLWATFAYFHGIKGTLSGRAVEMQAHEKEAGAIASAGSDWAQKVLRREDMEIYMFRLLLEWGRLVDDRRDTLGFMVLE